MFWGSGSVDKSMSWIWMGYDMIANLTKERTSLKVWHISFLGLLVYSLLSLSQILQNQEGSQHSLLLSGDVFGGRSRCGDEECQLQFTVYCDDLNECFNDGLGQTLIFPLLTVSLAGCGSLYKKCGERTVSFLLCELSAKCSLVQHYPRPHQP